MGVVRGFDNRREQRAAVFGQSHEAFPTENAARDDASKSLNELRALPRFDCSSRYGMSVAEL